MASLSTTTGSYGSVVELLCPQGSNPLSGFRVGGGKGLAKVYDADLRSFTFECGSGVKLSLPRDEKGPSLGLHQPYLLLQAWLGQGQALTVELIMSDTGGTRRRLVLSSAFTEAKFSLLHVQVPLVPAVRDAWVSLVIPLAALLPLAFKGAEFRALDALVLGGAGCAMRLRGIAALRSVPPELLLGDVAPPGSLAPGWLPKGLQVHSGAAMHAQLLDLSSLAAGQPHHPSDGTGRTITPLLGLAARRSQVGRLSVLTVSVDSHRTGLGGATLGTDGASVSCDSCASDDDGPSPPLDGTTATPASALPGSPGALFGKGPYVSSSRGGTPSCHLATMGSSPVGSVGAMRPPRGSQHQHARASPSVAAQPALGGGEHARALPSVAAQHAVAAQPALGGGEQARASPSVAAQHAVAGQPALGGGEHARASPSGAAQHALAAVGVSGGSGGPDAPTRHAISAHELGPVLIVSGVTGGVNSGGVNSSGVNHGAVNYYSGGGGGGANSSGAGGGVNLHLNQSRRMSDSSGGAATPTSTPGGHAGGAPGFGASPCKPSAAVSPCHHSSFAAAATEAATAALLPSQNRNQHLSGSSPFKAAAHAHAPASTPQEGPHPPSAPRPIGDARRVSSGGVAGGVHGGVNGGGEMPLETAGSLTGTGLCAWDVAQLQPCSPSGTPRTHAATAGARRIHHHHHHAHGSHPSSAGSAGSAHAPHNAGVVSTGSGALSSGKGSPAPGALAFPPDYLGGPALTPLVVTAFGGHASNSSGVGAGGGTERGPGVGGASSGGAGGRDPSSSSSASGAAAAPPPSPGPGRSRLGPDSRKPSARVTPTTVTIATSGTSSVGVGLPVSPGGAGVASASSGRRPSLMLQGQSSMMDRAAAAADVSGLGERSLPLPGGLNHAPGPLGSVVVSDIQAMMRSTSFPRDRYANAPDSGAPSSSQPSSAQQHAQQQTAQQTTHGQPLQHHPQQPPHVPGSPGPRRSRRPSFAVA
ncbi:hypothetical protein FOA52_008915 [Chlamydomonas sp. UWO 241]|nr:hypothetical protein FOA52_008915 [Chlamydomonas sp. UWO 241]